MLRRLAWASVVLVLLVTSLSAFLRLSKAGVGCADWPHCYGQSQRDLQQGITVRADEQTATAAARLVHRIAATGALLLVVMMVLLCVGSRPALRNEGALAAMLLALALGLAVLGRWSSDARIPAVTMANVLGGFAMVALCARLGVVGTPIHPPRLRLWVGLALLVTIAQIALGSLVSASYSALSCGSWADCLATARGLEWGTLNPWREPTLSAMPGVNPQGALANLLHRGLGLSLVALLLPLTIMILRRGRPRAAAALFLLLVAQAAIGVAMLQGPLPMSFALLHNLLAASLLATLALVY
jgi:cytochrome c oxidase assembly protein subunit 15